MPRRFSRFDKITHPHVQRSDGGHDPFSDDRNHEYNESGNDHLYCLSSGGQSHQIRQNSRQKEQSGKDVEDCGRESNDKPYPAQVLCEQGLSLLSPRLSGKSYPSHRSHR